LLLEDTVVVAAATGDITFLVLLQMGKNPSNTAATGDITLLQLGISPVATGDITLLVLLQMGI